MGIYKKGKIFGVFNILDILVLLTVLLIITGLAVRHNLLNKVKVDSSSGDIQFSIRVERLRDYSYNAINVGDPVYDQETGTLLGTVTDKKKEPYKERVDMPNGTIVFASMPDRYVVTITVKGKGDSTADGNYINGNRLIAPNGTIGFATNLISSEGIILTSEQIQP